MPRRDLTLADRIALLEQIKNQLADITGAPKCTVARVIQQQEKLRDEWTLCHGQQEAFQ
jgi:hypothetical protein